MSNSFIWPIDKTLSGATTRVDLGVMTIKGYSAFPSAPKLLEPHHQIVLYHNQDTRWGSLTPLEGCSQCIQQHQPTGPSGNLSPLGCSDWILSYRLLGCSRVTIFGNRYSKDMFNWTRTCNRDKRQQQFVIDSS